MKLFNHTKSKLLRTIPVPDDLSAVTTHDPNREAAAADGGMSTADVAAIWKSVEDLYLTGVFPGISLCLRRHGQVLLNRAIGHSHGNGPGDPPGAPKILMTPDTPVCQYSASKAVTAMMIHLLSERGQIRLSDPVARYIPEFAAHGKQDITIDHLISHHGGIPAPPPGTDAEILFDPDAFIKLICDLEPAARGGQRMAYHAVTGGAILGEIVRRVSGLNLAAYLDQNIRQPLGLRHFTFGADEADIARVAANYDTGPPLLFPFSTIAKRALTLPWAGVVQIANDPRFYRTIIPAANLVATADEMSQFFQLLLNGGKLNGVQIFQPQTVRRAITESDRMWFDGTVMIPMRYSAGFMLGASPVGLWGPYCKSAFGHVGFINIFCWADPDRSIAISLQTTGKCLIGPHLPALVRFLFTVGRRCRPESGNEPDIPYSRLLGQLHKMLRKLILEL